MQRQFRARAIPDTTWRRLRNTPSYFFIIWRWAWWIYAFLIIVYFPSMFVETPQVSYWGTAITLLIVTFLQTLIVTLYTPLFRILIPQTPAYPVLQKLGFKRKQRQSPPFSDREQDADILAPLGGTRNLYWDILILGGDLLICGLVVYFSGPFASPTFGVGSIFYRYGLSVAFAASFAYYYRGGLIIALFYDCFSLAGLWFPAPGSRPYVPNIIDIAGSVMDAPVVAILAAYLASLLANYLRSKRQIQNQFGRQRTLVSAGTTLLRESGQREHMLEDIAELLREGARFQRLVLIICTIPEKDSNTNLDQQLIQKTVIADSLDTSLPPWQASDLEKIWQHRKPLNQFEGENKRWQQTVGRALLYVPLFKDEHIALILGAESIRSSPFDRRHEEFLNIAGLQLFLTLENFRLTEQSVQLAAAAERDRIAREIHDGIAQLTYMLSLQAETSAAQARRIAEASEEDVELLLPLIERLDKIVTVSKQALWETRNYMFTLKPLMHGMTNLSQMLENQAREFQTITDLTVVFRVEGQESGQAQSQRQAQVGIALFRIVQEALTNAYKHAQAKTLEVTLRYLSDWIEVDVSDDGRGLQQSTEQQERIYSGYGVQGMKNRAEELAGTLFMEPRTSGGMSIRVRMPYEQQGNTSVLLEQKGAENGENSYHARG